MHRKKRKASRARMVSRATNRQAKKYQAYLAYRELPVLSAHHAAMMAAIAGAQTKAES